jgi:hypothetical protein
VRAKRCRQRRAALVRWAVYRRDPFRLSTRFFDFFAIFCGRKIDVLKQWVIASVALSYVCDEVISRFVGPVHCTNSLPCCPRRQKQRTAVAGAGRIDTAFTGQHNFAMVDWHAPQGAESRKNRD